MKLAVLTLAYNEEEYIGGCIRQFKPFNPHHLVLLSTKSWNNTINETDETERIAKREGAEVITQFWESEHTQRNWGLARLYDYDYVLIVDADEYYTQADIKKIINSLKGENCYRATKITTYWKDTEHIFDPPDRHKPIIAVNPKEVKFYEHRQPTLKSQYLMLQYQPIIDVNIHHFSWAKSDEKVLEKIGSFSHANDIPLSWYYDVWLKWTPDMENIRPYGIEKSKAVFKPAPKEIKDLI